MCEDEDEEELWEQKSTKKRERKKNTLKGTTHTGDGSGECSQAEERGTNGRLCRVPLHLSAQLEHQVCSFIKYRSLSLPLAWGRLVAVVGFVSTIIVPYF